MQLVQAAATMRIQNKTRLLENQIIVPQGYEFIFLNQRRILTSRDYAIPQRARPQRPAVPAWRMVKVGPRELMGRMAIEVEGGSTAPENVPQQRQDAQMFIQLSQDPRLDGPKLLIRGLELMGVEQPEGYLAPAAMQVPAPMIEQFLTSDRRAARGVRAVHGAAPAAQAEQSPERRTAAAATGGGSRCLRSTWSSCRGDPGTIVNVYQRRSELMLDDQPPPMRPLVGVRRGGRRQDARARPRRARQLLGDRSDRRPSTST